MKFDWVFRKYVPPKDDEPVQVAPEAEADASPAADAAPVIDWRPRLEAALGSDDALLALLRESGPVDLKMAAVAALSGEAALKLAEREHRGHDRRVHRLAKQRYLAQVAWRETGESADRLIVAAQALVEEALVPTNRLVELDRAWQGLDLTLLDAMRRAEFDALLARLVAATRARGDHTLEIERWTAAARQALARLQAACTSAAAGTTDRSHLAGAGVAARDVVEAAPSDGAPAALYESLRNALDLGGELDDRLAVLDALLQGPASAAPAPAAPEPVANDAADPVPVTAEPGEAIATAEPTETAEATEPAGSSKPAEAVERVGADAPIAAAARPRDVLSRWLELAPLADTQLAEALARRFEQWQNAREEARQARRNERRERARERERQVRQERTGTLAGALERAEAALAAGQLADTHKHLLEIDDLLHGGASATALQSRIDAVQAEYTRLKGWQHWGGGLARDELLLQAEALAAATLGEPGAATVKISVRQQAEVIDDLRARWKELDKLGGATSRSHWQRFDAALKTAYGPVAAHLDLQRAARMQNLAARDQLVAALNAVPMPDPGESDARPDWKSLAAALARFQTEWRKLGPLEHTVPRKERDKLVARMDAAVQRLEAPLNEARQGAQLVRERLIARAQALAAEAAAGAQGRDLVGKVRELQAEWQQNATTLPLARAVENALWNRFRSDVDAIFSARDAVFNARDAQFQAHGAERASLIERLAGVAADASPAELKRVLAEVESQWQRAGPAPRADGAALEARFRDAHEKVRRQLGSYAQRSWQATCDALIDKLMLCDALEQAADAAEARAAFEQGWAAQPALPPAWEQALARRTAADRGAAGRNGPAAASIDDLLLQLEAGLQLQSPPAFEAARRDLKLRAMKAALEGRKAAASTPLTPGQLLAALLERASLDDTQRGRLGQVIATVRDRGPASVG